MSRLQPTRSPVALGGMLAAITVAFAAMSQFMPLFFGLIAPLPIAVAVLLVSVRFAILVTVVASILIGILLGGPLAGISFACQSALMGIVGGALIKQRRPYGSVFIFVTLAQAGGMALYLLIQLAVMGFDITAFMQTFFTMEEDMIASAESLGVFNAIAQTSGITALEAEETFRHTTHLFMQMIPGIYTVLFALMTALHLWILRWVCKRMNITPNLQSPDMKSVIMPTWVLVPVLGAWITLLANRYIDIHLLWIVAVNVMVIGAACMVVEGFSYTIAKLRFSEATPLMKLLYIMLAFFMGIYLFVVLAVFGVFDCISDFRHLRTTKKGAKSI